MPLYLWLIVFHPVLVTLLALIVLVLLLRWTGWWARYKYRILLVLLAAYAIDTAFALPRILFAHDLSKEPVIARRIPLPSRLVLVNIPCDAKCHDWLISGEVEEIVSFNLPRYGSVSAISAQRYRADWVIPGTCPWERQRENRQASQAQGLSGYCPRVESVDVPTEGVFLVSEGTIVSASQRARPYTPTYLVKAPPGRVIHFVGIEVQNRSSAGTDMLASAYYDEAPGLLGLPPLIGCWDRPDNVIWIMPAGDTGCGLWRWFTGGGNQKFVTDTRWLFERVFGPPDRVVVPPRRADLRPPTPAQALEILSSEGSIEFALPYLRNALLNDALAEMIVKRARRGTLEGSLVALLAANRPAAMAGLSGRLKPFPRVFVEPAPVLDAMEKDPKFRDAFADVVLFAMAANWQPQSEVGRFLNLMETHQPGWLCERLDRFTGPDGILKTRENGVMKNVRETTPFFIAPIVERTAPRCPDATVDLLRALPPAPDRALRFCKMQASDTSGKTNGNLQGASSKVEEFCSH